jgi:signal transduction histidine kinase
LSHLVSRLAIGGMLLAVIATGAVLVWANLVAESHVTGLSGAGMQTSAHLRAVQALGQIDTHTDLLEEHMDLDVVADLRAAQHVLHDSLRRIERQAVAASERRLVRETERDVARLGPAIDTFLLKARTRADDQGEAEDALQEILAGLQIRFNDVGTDPSELFAAERAAAAADDRLVDRAAMVLIPLALLLIAVCAWQLHAYRRRTERERERMAADLRVAQRLEAAGQLAAGIAHEINTPIQFVGDSVSFLRRAYEAMRELGDEYRDALAELADDGSPVLARVRDAEEHADLDYLQQRIPFAFARTLDGVDRVSTLVAAMKAFGRHDQLERAPADLNEALRSTLVVAQNEYKYVADVETDFGELEPVVCNISELNQVFLNLIINAAHAIGEHTPAASDERGRIRVRTARENGAAIVEISDTGPGIPNEIRERIFDPFFTTKEVGRGTGQGLAIARAIVDKHGGSLTHQPAPGRGTRFVVSLPA